MKAGDLIRFRTPHWLGGTEVPEDQCPWLVGLLIEYHVWEKMTTVLYEGKIVRLQARRVEKCGKNAHRERIKR
jgi:hypothetical protein